MRKAKLDRRWQDHPRLPDVARLVQEGEPRAFAIAQRLGIPGDVARQLLAVVTGEFEYYGVRPPEPEPEAASDLASDPASATPESPAMPERLPYKWQLRLFKRIAYNEDMIEQRKRERKPTDYHEHEMLGILWLLDRAGIHYERTETMGIPAHKIPLAPEPPRPSAIAEALAKAQENAVNAQPFLEAACKRKISYSTEEAAGRAIVRLRAEGASNVQHAYPCGVCKGWHLTALDAERSDLARQIVETRRPERPRSTEEPAIDPLPSREVQAKIVASYIRGVSTADIAFDQNLHERLVIRILCDQGYAVSIAQEEHRRQGWPG
jgi:hypothetical protein